MNRILDVSIRWALVLLCGASCILGSRRFLASHSLEQARTAARAADDAAAEKKVARAFRLAAGDPRVLVPLARGAAADLWGNSGSIPGSRIFMAALDTNILYGPIWQRAAVWRLAAGDSIGARFALDRAVLLDPTNPTVRYFAATLAFQEGSYDRFRSEAIEALALADLPDFERLPWKDADRPAAWLEAMERRKALYPSLAVDADVEAAKALAATGRVEEALERLARIRPSAGSRVWWVDLQEATIRARNGDPQTALKILDERLSARRLWAEQASQLALFRAEILTKNPSSDPTRTERAVEEALRVSPESTQLYAWLVDYHGRRNDWPRALAWAVRYASADPENPARWSALAETALSAGDWPQARSAWERALRAGGSLEIAHRFIDLSLRRGELGIAEETLAQQLARYPDDPKLLLYARHLRGGDREAGSPAENGAAAPESAETATR